MNSNPQTPQRLRVLISAYACEPNKGSEPGVGWNWALRLAEHCEVRVITRANNRGVIEADPRSRSIQWIYRDGPAWLLKLKKGRLGVWLYYRLWQYGAYRAARPLTETGQIDLVHHLTFGTYWAPTDMTRLSVPLVIGPVGGGELVPWPCIFNRMSLGGIAYECQRNLAILLRRVSPWKRRFFRKVTLFITKNRETADELRRAGARVGGICSEAAVSAQELAVLHAAAAGRPDAGQGPFRMLCVGELRALKGGHFVLKALGRLRTRTGRPLECVFLGAGPERRRLEKLAVRYGVADIVRFAGRVPRAEVLRCLGSADVLLHPTLHDSGGWTCLEAMAAAVPVIALDVGGPAMQVDASCGLLIPPSGVDRIVRDLTEHLLTLIQSPETLKAMGAAGQARVAAQYVWEPLVSGFLRYYETAVNR